MRNDVLLGIDAGTSSVKLCAFSLDGTMLKKINKTISLIHGENGHVEIDVKQYWNYINEMISQITSDNNINIVGVGFSTTCPTTILMDGQLEAVRPGITYLDNRASGYVKSYAENFSDEDSYFAAVGNRAAVSTCSISNVMWLQENEPENWRRTSHIGMLNSYFAGKLTGSIAVDCTQASYSGILNLQNRATWDTELLDIAGINKDKLLSVLQPSEKIGSVTAEASIATGLPEGCPVAIGSADTAAAAFAIGINRTDTAFESVGTSGVLTLLLDKPVFDPIFMNRCHVIPGQWLAHGAMSMMGGALSWLGNNIFNECDSPEQMESLLGNTSPGANGVIFLPYLSGERCPVWDPDAMGIWYGMTIKTNKSDLIEAVYESGAFALKQIMDHSKVNLGADINSIIAVGNGTKSNFWNQLKSDVLQVDYTPTSNVDAAAFGAAMLGGVAAEIFSDVMDQDIPKIVPDYKTYQPSGGNEYQAYMRSYEIYNALYPALKGVMHMTHEKSILK